MKMFKIMIAGDGVLYIIQNGSDRISFANYAELEKACAAIKIPCVPEMPKNIQVIQFSNSFFEPSFVQYLGCKAKFPFSELKTDTHLYINLINSCKAFIKASYGDLPKEYWLGTDDKLALNSEPVNSNKWCCTIS